MTPENDAIPTCQLPRRRSFWEQHGSWVLLSVTAIGFTGLGLQIGAHLSINNLTAMALQHAQDLRDLQDEHRKEVAVLTSQLSQAALNASKASQAAAASAAEAANLATSVEQRTGGTNN